MDGAYGLEANAYLMKPTPFDDLLALAHSLRQFWLQWNTPPRTLVAG